MVVALHGGELRSTDRLADELWGEQPPATAVDTVQGSVSRLPGALGPTEGRPRRPKGRPRAKPPGDVLEPDAVESERYRRMSAHAAADDDAVTQVLWRGLAASFWSGAICGG